MKRTRLVRTHFGLAIILACASLRQSAHARPSQNAAHPGHVTLEPWKHAAVFGSDEAWVGERALIESATPGKPGNLRANKLVKLAGDATVRGDVLSAQRIQKSGNNVTVTGQEDDRAGMLTYPSLTTFIDSQKNAHNNALLGRTNLGTNPLSGSKFALQGSRRWSETPGSAIPSAPEECPNR